MKSFKDVLVEIAEVEKRTAVVEAASDYDAVADTIERNIDRVNRVDLLSPVYYSIKSKKAKFNRKFGTLDVEGQGGSDATITFKDRISKVKVNRDDRVMMILDKDVEVNIYFKG